jgi:hypothetical protein
MNKIVNTVALVGLGATAVLAWVASRNARAQGARDINRWEDEGGKVPEVARAESGGSAEAMTHSAPGAV